MTDRRALRKNAVECCTTVFNSASEHLNVNVLVSGKIDTKRATPLGVSLVFTSGDDIVNIDQMTVVSLNWMM
jgi:hypothetical protein